MYNHVMVDVKKLGFLEADYAADYESFPVRVSAVT